MKCLNCQTELPAGARFCFNCGVPQPPPQEEKQAPPQARVDLQGNVEQQLAEQFFSALRRRVEEELQASRFQAYSERLYESGFRDTLQRRAGQLAEELNTLSQEGELPPALINRKVESLFEKLLDYFIIHYCRDINELNLPEAILRYQDKALDDIDLLQMVLDYLDFENEPDEKVFTDFLKMPVDKLKNAGRFFLFPERNERIFLICDQSLFGSCKEGFALTEHAFYWKAQLQTARSVPYTSIRELRREKEWLLIDGHFFNASPSLNVKIMKLLAKLRQLFTNA